MSVCVVDDYNPCGYYERINGESYCSCNNCKCSEVIQKEDCHWDPESADRLLTD